MVLVELNVPEGTADLLVAVYATFAAFSVCLNLVSMLSCVMMLVGVLKYDCVKRNQV